MFHYKLGFEIMLNAVILLGEKGISSKLLINTKKTFFTVCPGKCMGNLKSFNEIWEGAVEFSFLRFFSRTLRIHRAAGKEKEPSLFLFYTHILFAFWFEDTLLLFFYRDTFNFLNCYSVRFTYQWELKFGQILCYLNSIWSDAIRLWFLILRYMLLLCERQAVV